MKNHEKSTIPKQNPNHFKSKLSIEQEQFFEKVMGYCENPKRYSIKPFIKKNPGIRALKKEDAIYISEVCEYFQERCFINALGACGEDIISNTSAVKYMRENSQALRDYEQHVLKFEKIDTEEQACSLIDRFCTLDIMFIKLAKNIDNYKGYDAKAFIEQAGYNYEEIMARALISDKWKITVSVLHEICFHNCDDALLYNKGKSITEEKANEYMEQLDRWNRIKDGKEKPNVEQKIIIGSTTMEESTNTKATQTKQLLDVSMQERENRYLEQSSKVKPGFEFEAKEQEDGKISIDVKNADKVLLNTFKSTLHAITGSTNSDYSRSIISRTIAAMILDKENENIAEEANAFVNVLLEMAPKDITDSILCRRILTLDKHIINLLAKAKGSNNIDTMDRYINNATKLSRLQNETIEARTRYLRHGEQKYTVTHQHVNVHGGKTVISGNLNQGGGNGKS